MRSQIELAAMRAVLDAKPTPTAEELLTYVTLDGAIAGTLRAFTTYAEIMEGQ